jgi:hypothetical protein
VVVVFFFLSFVHCRPAVLGFSFACTWPLYILAVVSLSSLSSAPPTPLVLSPLASVFNWRVPYLSCATTMAHWRWSLRSAVSRSVACFAARAWCQLVNSISWTICMFVCHQKTTLPPSKSFTALQRHRSFLILVCVCSLCLCVFCDTTVSV